MVTGYFGVPGCGKSTMMTKIAIKALKKGRYDNVYCNFPVAGCKEISVKDLCEFRTPNSLILLDELTLDVDSRDYKKFDENLKEYFTMHRHDGVDLIYFVQDWSRVDKTIRNVTFDLWYLSTSVVPIFKHFSRAKRIFRNVSINDYMSELIMGYRFANFWELVFSSPVKICFRPRWYKYFDSYDLGGLAERKIFYSNLYKKENFPRLSKRDIERFY